MLLWQPHKQVYAINQYDQAAATVNVGLLRRASEQISKLDSFEYTRYSVLDVNDGEFQILLERFDEKIQILVAQGSVSWFRTWTCQ